MLLEFHFFYNLDAAIRENGVAVAMASLYRVSAQGSFDPMDPNAVAFPSALSSGSAQKGD